MSDQLETIDSEALATANGGITQDQIPSSAHWVMMHESGGNTHATNPTSTAFGAFQMLKATRKQYMGSDWQSTDFTKQYNGATKYVDQRYGGWNQAESFWKAHRWY